MPLGGDEGGNLTGDTSGSGNLPQRFERGNGNKRRATFTGALGKLSPHQIERTVAVPKNATVPLTSPSTLLSLRKTHLVDPTSTLIHWFGSTQAVAES